ncbi:MAG: hypothetical protein IJ827_06925 [Lachnospiraceae bacterium]|nr:hypothetical protein [Lachnospiraceae bacterium]MBR1914538.1 hypothetical protein [Lachnospiraceae bacterium]
MTKQEMLERVIASYEHYYDVNRDTPTEPFVAEAVFRSHGEEYFLIKSAKLTEMDSSEVAFFADVEHLDTTEYERLVDKVWDETLSRADVKPNHRNSDGILIIAADEIDADTKKKIKKTRRYKSYRFTLWGWSELRVIAYEHASAKVVSNRQGDMLKRLFTIKK